MYPARQLTKDTAPAAQIAFPRREHHSSEPRSGPDVISRWRWHPAIQD